MSLGEDDGLTTSVRAQRSNPESLCGKTLDCFAALAMTGIERRRSRTAVLPDKSDVCMPSQR
ncbi:hypothetical protein XH89_00355 [Bradyrhizobium sp. CCBAU 53340]|nr:hypothetical protein XH89_00355 [Bradyrhizobium sp. CCBAU 53340]